MLRSLILSVCLMFVALQADAPRPDALPYRDPRLPVPDRVRDLLSRMTLEEKFWQLYMIPGDLDDPANDYSHGIFGLQISAGGRSPDTGATSRRQSTPDAARQHAERVNASHLPQPARTATVTADSAD